MIPAEMLHNLMRCYDAIPEQGDDDATSAAYDTAYRDFGDQLRAIADHIDPGDFSPPIGCAFMIASRAWVSLEEGADGSLGEWEYLRDAICILAALITAEPFQGSLSPRPPNTSER